MKVHELKCKSEFFDAIVKGEKRFEYRVNDRNYEVGDVLKLRRICSCLDEAIPEGDILTVKITSLISVVAQDSQDYCIMSIVPFSLSLNMEIGDQTGVKRIEVIYVDGDYSDFIVG